MHELQVEVDTARARYAEAYARSLQPRRPAFHGEVFQAVAALFNVTAEDLFNDLRDPIYVEARAVVAKVLMNRNPSLARTAKIMKRDRSSIRNLLNKLDVYKERNPMVARALGIVS